MKEEDIKKLIRDEVKNQLKGGLFTARKLTDTPTDRNQVVPRGYVTRSFTTALRPTTSVLGESYFDTDHLLTVTWNGTFYQDPAGNAIT